MHQVIGHDAKNMICTLLGHFQAFDVAKREFGIEPVTSGEKMAENNLPDKRTMLAYLSQFYELFRKESARPAKRRKSLH